MEKTKDTIRSFMNKAGHHDTTVHQEAAPAVQHETVKPTQHENVNTAVDREVHQDHYVHKVQPVHDQEILPEKHHHNVGAVEHRDFDHRDHGKTKEALNTEAQKFKDERVVTDTTHTQSHAPVVSGEHVHHHVHEKIQPVIHKETIQPNVVHTTVPIHETHHNAAQHHATTTLPAVSMNTFKKAGGALGSHEGETHTFDGCPEDKGLLKSSHNQGSTATGTHDHHHTGVTSTGTSAQRDNLESGHAASGPLGGSKTMRQSETTEKPSLMNKLNPKTDTTGQGNPGFMR